MPVEYVFRPLTQWPPRQPPTPAYQRVHGQFKAGWQDTMDMLDRELGKLRVRQCIVQLKLKESEIRLDGRPRADATPSDPSVVISFDSKHGPLLLPCDHFRSWQNNVRAIAYHLQRLRESALYGVGQHGEQYRGWKALPDQSQLTPAMNVEQAATFIGEQVIVVPSSVIGDVEYYRRAYRAAAGKLHPDRGGDPAKWNQLQEAKRVLDQHHAGNAV
jgi:hypothetical protein